MTLTGTFGASGPNKTREETVHIMERVKADTECVKKFSHGNYERIDDREYR